MQLNFTTVSEYLLAIAAQMRPNRGRDSSKREKQPVIKNRDNRRRKKNIAVDWKRKIKKVILRKRNSETEEERREEEEEAEYKPSFCPNYCVTVGLSSNLSPSLHTHPPSCHILYRPIWIKTGMNRRETEWERETERKRENHRHTERKRERKREGERDVMDSGTVCLQPGLHSLLSHCSGW